jgi:flagellar protein FliS
MNRHASAVRQAYTESSIMTAPPERLVVMLYDGAIRFLMQSAEAMRAGTRERARERMRRAEAVIDELNLSLDMKYGEIPQRLRSVYLFCKRQIVLANLEAQPEHLDRVTELLGDLRDSWAQIAEGAAVPAPASA